MTVVQTCALPIYLEEGVGVEPTDPRSEPPGFEPGAIDRSANLPLNELAEGAGFEPARRGDPRLLVSSQAY